jgi:hypothetical protein
MPKDSAVRRVLSHSPWHIQDTTTTTVQVFIFPSLANSFSSFLFGVCNREPYPILQPKHHTRSSPPWAKPPDQLRGIVTTQMPSPYTPHLTTTPTMMHRKSMASLPLTQIAKAQALSLPKRLSSATSHLAPPVPTTTTPASRTESLSYAKP